MKRIELNGYAVNAIPHPAEESARMLVIESHMKDAQGLPAEVFTIGLTQEVADMLAQKLTGGEIAVVRDLPHGLKGFQA
jgi:hypothetical protein